MNKKQTFLSYKSLVRGRVFEAALRALLEKSGFTQNVITDQLTRNQKRLHGRGSTYDPDVIAQFSLGIPFVNPLLLIGEAKYYSNKVNIGEVRKFLGSYIDFSQYPSVNTRGFGEARYSVLYGTRFNYCPIFFSIKGFRQSAEALMFAHGINYISYENSEIMQEIQKLVEELINSLNVMRFQKGDFSLLDNFQLMEGLREELKKNTFNHVLDKFIIYLRSIDSLVGVLDRKFPVHILYSKKISASLSKRVVLKLDKKNKFILENISRRKFGEFSMSTTFIEGYLKYGKKHKNLENMIKQIDVVIKKRGVWELRQLLIDEVNRQGLITFFLGEANEN